MQDAGRVLLALCRIFLVGGIPGWWYSTFGDQQKRFVVDKLQNKKLDELFARRKRKKESKKKSDVSNLVTCLSDCIGKCLPCMHVAKTPDTRCSTLHVFLTSLAPKLPYFWDVGSFLANAMWNVHPRLLPGSCSTKDIIWSVNFAPEAEEFKRSYLPTWNCRCCSVILSHLNFFIRKQVVFWQRKREWKKKKIILKHYLLFL